MTTVAPNTTKETTVPQIPEPRPGNEIEVLRAIREVLDVREGLAGDPLDQVMTYREFFVLGKFDVSAQNRKVMARLPGVGMVFLDPNNTVTPEYNAPPAGTGLVVTPGIAVNIISWDKATYHGHSLTEVWRASVDNLGLAVRIGTSESFLYDDTIGDTNVQAYYWIRHVSRAGVPGKFNATAGTSGTTLAVGTGHIADASITTAKLVDGAVVTAKLGDSSVTTTKIGDSQVIEAKIGAAAVTTTKIGDSSVTTAKINDLSVTTGKFADDSVTTAKLGPNSVTAAKLWIQSHAINGLVFTNNSPGAGSVAWSSHTIQWNGSTFAIGAGNSSAEMIWLDRSTSTTALQGSTRAAFEAAYDPADGDILLAANSGGIAETVFNATLVTGGAIKTGAIVADKIAANAIVAGKIAVAAIVAGDGVIANAAIGTALIQDAAITNAKIGSLAVDTAKIADAAIVAAKIADLEVTAAKIANATITAAKIAAATITAALIENATITNAKIANATIEGGKIAASTITGDKISSATTITAGSGNDVAVLDGADLTYRIYAGNATAASAPFSVKKDGTVTVKSGTSGARLEITNSVIKVFDSAGTVRVKIGDLT